MCCIGMVYPLNSLDLKKASVSELVSAYTQAAAAQGRAAVAGDYVAANQNYDILAAAYRELRERGHDSQCALLPLLINDDIDVKAWAAAHALEFSPFEGQRVLEELAQKPGIIGLEANMTLREWRNGKLKFP